MNRVPEKSGPGLLFILVTLVVVGIVGARFFGFSWMPKRSPEPHQAPSQQPSGDQAVLGEPEVLIVHAYGTQNYSPKPALANGEPGDIIDVGASLTAALANRGIRAVHLTTLHDWPKWSEAPEKLRQSIRNGLARYTTIKAVIDLHRDAIDRPDNVPVLAAQSTPAKILLVVGDTDNPNAKENVAFMTRLDAALKDLHPGVSRGFRIQHQMLGGDLFPNTVSVYLGEYKTNTVQEAKVAAEQFADALVRVLREE